MSVEFTTIVRIFAREESCSSQSGKNGSNGLFTSQSASKASGTGRNGAAMLPPGWAAFSNAAGQNTNAAGSTSATNSFYWPWHGGWTDFNHNEPENSREAPPDAVSQEGEAQEATYTAPIHESCLRLAFLLKARRSAGRWWSSDKADWKSVVVTWSGRRLFPLHCMNRLLLKRNIIPRTNIALSLRTRQRSSLWEISKR